MAIGAIAGHFAQKRQHKYVKKYMKNKYQWEVADLIAAGLNPILGYTKGGPPIGPAGIPSVGGEGLAASAISAIKAKSELELLEATADRQTSEAVLARSRAHLEAQRSKKVSLEVKEFPIKPSGVARRLFSPEAREGVRNFLQKVGNVPNWIRESMKNAAER